MCPPLEVKSIPAGAGLACIKIVRKKFIVFGLFKKSSLKDTATDLYLRIVEQSRMPVFYEKLGVADTLEARFDMILLHAFLVLHRFKNDREQTKQLGQELFDYMFGDFDRSLREMSIGDVGIAIRIKKMAEAFQGRINAFDKSVEEDEESLKQVLQRNLYHNETPTDEQLTIMCRYIMTEVKALSGVATEHFFDGKLPFGSPDLTVPPAK